uniref:PH domain-containing protein n=1 Tax=Chromera velia CCMP2878 TaxID=1169474 RepID=A0A0G4HZS1_9ALVE|eukprot:Cvel_9756.t1-p1 / transcript=Cvel_9756.t1 / gene=Cvel_9756 / organism=Chromera_velia_CCMP2878 / gene_product=hypothetical protein / transcript_product=hypothetical protein / location=Cvel_scaffold571:12373-31696(+) / protein_length=1372 / sequence_SO=supercontig / SO=protein_coding / is_pseudo=false
MSTQSANAHPHTFSIYVQKREVRDFVASSESSLLLPSQVEPSLFSKEDSEWRKELEEAFLQLREGAGSSAKVEAFDCSAGVPGAPGVAPMSKANCKQACEQTKRDPSWCDTKVKDCDDDDCKAKAGEETVDCSSFSKAEECQAQCKEKGLNSEICKTAKGDLPGGDSTDSAPAPTEEAPKTGRNLELPEFDCPKAADDATEEGKATHKLNCKRKCYLDSKRSHSFCDGLDPVTAEVKEAAATIECQDKTPEACESECKTKNANEIACMIAKVHPDAALPKGTDVKLGGFECEKTADDAEDGAKTTAKQTCAAECQKTKLSPVFCTMNTDPTSEAVSKPETTLECSSKEPDACIQECKDKEASEATCDEAILNGEKGVHGMIKMGKLVKLIFGLKDVMTPEPNSVPDFLKNPNNGGAGFKNHSGAALLVGAVVEGLQDQSNDDLVKGSAPIRSFLESPKGPVKSVAHLGHEGSDPAEQMTAVKDQFNSLAQTGGAAKSAEGADAKGKDVEILPAFTCAKEDDKTKCIEKCKASRPDTDSPWCTENDAELDPAGNEKEFPAVVLECSKLEKDACQAKCTELKAPADKCQEALSGYPAATELQLEDSEKYTWPGATQLSTKMNEVGQKMQEAYNEAASEIKAFDDAKAEAASPTSFAPDTMTASKDVLGETFAGNLELMKWEITESPVAKAQDLFIDAKPIRTLKDLKKTKKLLSDVATAVKEEETKAAATTTEQNFLQESADPPETALATTLDDETQVGTPMGNLYDAVKTAMGALHKEIQTKVKAAEASGDAVKITSWTNFAFYVDHGVGRAISKEKRALEKEALSAAEHAIAEGDLDKLEEARELVDQMNPPNADAKPQNPLVAMKSKVEIMIEDIEQAESSEERKGTIIENKKFKCKATDLAKCKEECKAFGIAETKCDAIAADSMATEIVVKKVDCTTAKNKEACEKICSDAGTGGEASLNPSGPLCKKAIGNLRPGRGGSATFEVKCTNMKHAACKTECEKVFKGDFCDQQLKAEYGDPPPADDTKTLTITQTPSCKFQKTAAACDAAIGGQIDVAKVKVDSASHNAQYKETIGDLPTSFLSQTQAETEKENHREKGRDSPDPSVADQSVDPLEDLYGDGLTDDSIDTNDVSKLKKALDNLRIAYRINSRRPLDVGRLLSKIKASATRKANPKDNLLKMAAVLAAYTGLRKHSKFDKHMEITFAATEDRALTSADMLDLFGSVRLDEAFPFLTQYYSMVTEEEPRFTTHTLLSKVEQQLDEIREEKGMFEDVDLDAIAVDEATFLAELKQKCGADPDCGTEIDGSGALATAAKAVRTAIDAVNKRHFKAIEDRKAELLTDRTALMSGVEGLTAELMKLQVIQLAKRVGS